MSTRSLASVFRIQQFITAVVDLLENYIRLGCQELATILKFVFEIMSHTVCHRVGHGSFHPRVGTWVGSGQVQLLWCM